MRKIHTHPQQPLFFQSQEKKTLLAEQFPTNYQTVIDYIEEINPSKYAKTRNFITGAVTYLSPYISRGFISTNTVKKAIEKKYTFYESEKLIQELAWREFFQRVWQNKGADILKDIKQQQQQVSHYKIPTAIVNASTRIDGIDTAIQQLYETGYMHNHARMYTAMLTCNIAQSHWLLPAQWMYYHLLDGDAASNMLSWQWVAGTFSSKKYYANQENISKYTNSKQYKSYIAVDYGAFETMPIPEILQPTCTINLQTTFPETEKIVLNTALPTLVYNSYNIDPLWHKNENCNRVLLLEPNHFNTFPVSEKVLNWIIALAKNNIADIQIFVGSFNDLKMQAAESPLLYKEHPTIIHYTGIKESREWMFAQVEGYFPSFFTFWKKCERFL